MADSPEPEVLVVAQEQSDGSTLIEVIEVHPAPAAEGPTAPDEAAEAVVELIEAILDSEGEPPAAPEALEGGGVVEVHEYVIAPGSEASEGEAVGVIGAQVDEAPSVGGTVGVETSPTPAEREEQVGIEGHATAAQHAQERADADIAAGDYHAAAHEREAAEAEAWEASDSGMLHGSSAVELEAAADRQDDARYHEAQEAGHAAAGDYAAARDDAASAASQQGWADHYAGGADHSGQARAEYEREDNAVWQEGQAHQDALDAQWYADRGDASTAETYASAAVDHQALADQYGHEGQHGAEGAVHDASSDVAHDTPVGDASADASAHFDDSAYPSDDGSAE